MFFNEKIPRFWSKRFRHILFLALRGDPLDGLLALYWFVTRRRVRGWSQLVVAANRSFQSYSRWVAASESSLFEAYRRNYPSVAANMKVAAVLLASDGESANSAQVTIRSLKAAFGDYVPIHAAPAPGDAAAESCRLGKFLERAAAESKADWILPLLCGDVLSRAAGDIVARAVYSAPDASVIYWDEDTLVHGRRADPWVKPQWDQTLFSAVDGLSGSSLLSISAMRKTVQSTPDLQLSRSGLHRLLLSIARCENGRAVRVPLLLTHRSEHNRLSFTLPSASLAPLKRPPSVTIIVPTRDRPDLLAACLRGIAETRYPGELGLILVDNGSKDAKALKLLQEAETAGATVIRDGGPFNFSRLINAAAVRAEGEFLCLYNNDVEPLDADWLQHMISYAQNPAIGAVGALLLYPSGRIQHAGVSIGMGGAAGHIQKGVEPDETQFRTWHGITREVSAVTAAVMVVRKAHFAAVGGFDEGAFPVAFNDVDLCLRLKKAGLRNLFAAEARLLHRESESRGDDRRPERAAKFAQELAALQSRWRTEGYDDPHFSPAFLWLSERCVLMP